MVEILFDPPIFFQMQAGKIIIVYKTEHDT